MYYPGSLFGNILWQKRLNGQDLLAPIQVVIFVYFIVLFVVFELDVRRK